MLLVGDVHGATGSLRRVASRGEPLLVLGDLINFIDYRTYDGLIAEVSGRDFVAEIVRLRSAGDLDGARRVWAGFAAGREDEVRRRYAELVERAYEEVCRALEGCTSYVTYGNADWPEVLVRHLPPSARFVDGESVELDGTRFGFVGGGMSSIGVPGEVGEEEMAAKLGDIGEVDVLCTHVPPAIDALARDVIGGRQKGSQSVLDYLIEVQPSWHYFGDIHQPQAGQWRVGRTRCHNVGYFRATGRAVRHG